MRLVDANAIEKELWRLRCQYQMLDDTQTADKIMHGLFRAEQVLKDAEVIDATPVVHGRWEWNINNGFYYCSKCQAVSPREDQDGEYCDCPNYCHNCGAKMDGGKDNGT